MQEINKKIQDIVAASYGIQIGDIGNWLSNAPKPEFGDYTFNVFELSKQLKRNPNDISTELKNEFSKYSDIFENVSNMGGYVNFFLNKDILIEEFNDLNIDDKRKKDETIIIDYIGPNVGKPLHIGHLCTPSQGQATINILRYLGYNIISDSHFGDWGGIFGKLIYTWEYGIDHDLGLDASECNNLLLKDKQKNYAENYFKECMLKKYGVLYLVKLYQLFFEINADDSHDNIEEDARREFQYLSGVGIDLNNEKERIHHEKNVELWKKFTAISIEGIEKQLELLNVRADYNIGESFYEGLDLPRPNNEDYPDLKYGMKDIVQELIEKGIATKNEDGSVGVVFPEETKIPSCVLQKKDGTGLYLTSDLAAIKYRLINWDPSKILYFVDVTQQLHLRQAFWIAKKAWGDDFKNFELIHNYNGFVKLKEGKMSTRKGNFITLNDVISEGFDRTEGILKEKGRNLSEENIRAIAISAIKYSYLSQDREKDVVFDWDKALSFEGNSGPSIQYAYVRANKILNGIEIGRYDNVEINAQDKSLIKKLLEFENKVLDAASKYKPHIIAQYCYELAQEFNSFYVHTPKILDEKDIGLKNFRLSLILKTTEILKKGFGLLAINMPNEM
ncbi:MAG: arginine--tRNA ligase [Candidatus Gracilibacteria bacterium]|nr:arginine--tRNA ligase [Candidatus Gracilibacteria bacterium]